MTCDGAAMTGGSCSGQNRGGAGEHCIRTRDLCDPRQPSNARPAYEAGSCYGQMAVQELLTAAAPLCHPLPPNGLAAALT